VMGTMAGFCEFSNKAFSFKNVLNLKKEINKWPSNTTTSVKHQYSYMFRPHEVIIRFFFFFFFLLLLDVQMFS
jgi:hypothetical protein